MTPIEIDKDKRYTGKILNLDKRGFGFISCKDIPFTRIFFHWSGLLPQTVNFIELRKNDEVEFNALEWIDRNTNESKGIRAIKIDVFEKAKEVTNGKDVGPEGQ